MSVTVEQDRIVKLTYRLLDPDGRVLDERTPANPYEFMAGRGQIVAPVERAIMGKTAGYRCEVHVSPREGYGDYKPDLVADIPRGNFPADFAVEVDMKFNTQDANGDPMTVRVIEVSKTTVTVDGNHPLAGLELDFEVRILDVRAASEEEVRLGRPGAPPLKPGAGSLH